MNVNVNVNVNDIMSYLHEGSVWWGLIASGKVGQLGKLHGAQGENSHLFYRKQKT